LKSRKLSTTLLPFVLALAALARAQTSQQQIRRITLKEAIATALRHQPDLTAAQAQAIAADQQHKQALAAYYPSLSAGWSTSDNYFSNPQVSGLTAVGGTTTGTNTQSAGNGASGLNSTSYADLYLSYTVLDSGQRSATEQSARAGSSASNWALANSKQTVIANAATDYYELLRRAALVLVQQANVQHAQSTLDLTQAQVDQGTQAIRDVYQARADLETAKVDLLTAQNNRYVALAQFKQALGLTDVDELEPADIRTDTNVSDDASKSLGDLLDVAYKTRPDILQAQQNVEREKANVRLARANNGLTLSVVTDVSSVFIQNQGNTRSLNLTASLPLFDAGLSRAAIKQAEATEASYAAQLASTRLAAKVDVETAYRTLQTARASVPAALSAQQAAQVNFDAATESRREGIGTVLDVITAQNQLVQSQTNYVQALYTLYTADVALLRAIGHTDAITGGLS